MSRSIYSVTYTPTDIAIDQIIKSIEKILQESARIVELNKKSTIERLPKREIQQSNSTEQSPFPGFEPIDEHKDLFEIKLPEEFTEDAKVFNEVIHVMPVKDGLQIMITDPSIPQNKCDEIAVKFSRRVYEEATGKKIGSKEVSVLKVGEILQNVCQYCMQTIEGFPYVCKICGRTFDYEHKNPEVHGCSIKQESEEKIVTQTVHRTTERKVEPKVVIRKIPCG